MALNSRRTAGLGVVLLLLVGILLALAVLPGSRTGLNEGVNASCTPTGDQPNPAGVTTVDQDSRWCGNGLRAGGNVVVGSSSRYVSLEMRGGSVQVAGSVQVGDGTSMKPVNLTISNFAIYLTVSASQILIERVPNSVASGGSTILINQNSLIQGNITDPNSQPLGLSIKSGPAPSYLLHLVRIEDTKFKDLGNYWNQDHAALDTFLSGSKGSSAIWSKFASGSYLTRLNFTNPIGMQGSPPADSPVAVFLGDSLPITHSEFYGGFMGAGFTKWQWDNRFHSVCRDSYDPEPGGLLQNNTYILGVQGNGCKNIDFFRGGIRFRNNIVTFSAGGTENLANTDAADNNVIENNTWISTGAGCAAGYVAVRLRFLNNSFSGGGIPSGDILERCNEAYVVNNVIRNPLYVGLAVINYPGDTQIYQNAFVSRNTVSGCGESEQSSVVCFNMRQQANGVVDDLGLTAAGGWATEIDHVTDSTFNNVAIANAKVGFRLLTSPRLVLQDSHFASISSLEYSFSDTSSVVIRNQAIDSYAVRVQSDTVPTAIQWSWNDLFPNGNYKVVRTGSITEEFPFSTDATGSGSLTVSNPTASVFRYALVLVSGSPPPVPPQDTTPPASVSDLSATRDVSGQPQLAWTAPGDDGNVGNASSYLLRYSVNGPVTASTWGGAPAYAQGWVPRAAGSAELHGLAGLTPTTQYWFAVRAVDEAGNLANLSNSAVLSAQFTNLQIAPVLPNATADGTVQFSATVYDSGGARVPVNPAWTSDNGSIGAGLFEPWSAGQWNVCATYESLSNCTVVSVAPGRIDRVSVLPPSLSLHLGDSVTLSVLATDAKSNAIQSIGTSWSVNPASLGVFSGGNTFTTNTEGLGSITAAVTDGSSTKTIVVDLAVIPASGSPDGTTPGSGSDTRTGLDTMTLLLLMLLACSLGAAAVSSALIPKYLKWKHRFHAVRGGSRPWLAPTASSEPAYAVRRAR